MPTLSFPQLKQLWRSVFPVKPGGPATGKVRSSRVIDALDALTDKVKEVADGAGAAATFPADAPATAIAVGNLPAGTVVASKPIAPILQQVWSQPETFPGYAQPFAQLGTSASGDVEQGTTITPTLTPGFTQGDAGNLTSYQLTRGATVLASDSSAPIQYPAVEDSYQIGEESITYQVLFSYAQGALKTGSQGSPAPGRILAGEKQAAVTFTGRARLFYGPAPAASTTSAQARALPASRFVTDGNVFLLNTGTVALVFEVVAPAGVTVSVIDLDALNAPMPYASSALTVKDAGGTDRSYTVWRLTIADPYSSNHRHQVTLS